MEDNDWDSILESARAVFEKKHNLVIFPEGHRSRDGELGRFYSGAFKIATELNVPIIPVFIVGTHEMLPPDRWWFKPAKIRVKVLDAVYPEGLSGETGHIELRKIVKKKMSAEIKAMRSVE